MATFFDRLRSRSLRDELAVAFGLVLLAFIVLLGYLFPGVSSFFQLKGSLWIVVLILSVIIILGLIVIVQIIEPIIRISREAKDIARGDLSREIKIFRSDELGELSESLNRMTQRIKENMEELKIFSEKTDVINVEINKRVVVLSSLLQISNLISQNAGLEEVIGLSMEKSLSATEMTIGVVVLKDPQAKEFVVRLFYGPKKPELVHKGLENKTIKLEEGILGKVLYRREPVIIDQNTQDSFEINEFRHLFSTKNAVLIPLLTKQDLHGLLMVGNDNRDYVCSQTDREMLILLSQQIAIAIENATLSSRVEKLEVIDSLTGLYNRSFIAERLDEEIKRAIRFQRPCSFVLFSLDHFEHYHDELGRIAAEQALKRIGAVLKKNANEVEKVGRFGDHQFALILPEKNKRQCIEIAETFRKEIEFIFSEGKKRITCTGAVTENPLDGISSEDLITKANEILESA